MVGTTGSAAHFSDLDQLAGEARDTGQLSEPLADSVLDYTLRRLKPDAKVDSRAVQELEKTIYPDDLSQLMDKDSTFQSQNSLAPMMRLDGQLYSAATDQRNRGATRIPLVSAPWDQIATAPMSSLQGHGYDWWQFGLDSIQQPLLPYDEMFGLDFNM